ncbi:MAG: hypothetical protein AAF236_07620 [Verrucomicrobiota bacterium]
MASAATPALLSDLDPPLESKSRSQDQTHAPNSTETNRHDVIVRAVIGADEPSETEEEKQNPENSEEILVLR